MCEFSLIKPELQIAEDDIVVYKIGTPKQTLFGLRKCIISGVFQFKYKLGKVYHSRLDPPTLGRTGNYYESKRGFYSYQTQNPDFPIDAPSVLIKCIIPKGSHYYKYVYSPNIIVYVSDKIKLIEILDNNE